MISKIYLQSGIAAAVLLLAQGLLAQTQTPVTFATGLNNPSKLHVTADGTLLVSEAGSTPNSGRISVIDQSGNRRTLVNGLPSGLSAPNLDPDGPNGIAVSGRNIFIENGEGDGFSSGTAPGSLIGNPAGPSSPLFASILQLTLSDDLSTVTGTFTLKLADQFTLLDGKSITMSDGAGHQGVFQIVSAFRPGTPDPRTVYRNSHPYAMTLSPAYPNTLFIADAGQNSIVMVNLTTGHTETILRFPPIPNAAGTVPPVSDAVPDSIRPYGSDFLVTLLTGAPFVPGSSRVMQVDPTNGTAAPFIGNLSSAIDVLERQSNGSAQFLVLEYSLSLTTGGPGQILLYNSPIGTVFASGLKAPTSMAIDEAAGALYVTNRTDGTIVKLSLPQ